MASKQKKDDDGAGSTFSSKKENGSGFSEKLIRDRVRELIRVPASELRSNDKKWRLHPDHQKSALKAVFAEVGIVDAIKARRLPTGELEIIDGEMRAEVMGDELVPVLILDLNDQEVSQVLATFDPIGELAVEDDLAFGNLLDDLGALMDDGDIRLMIDQIHREAVEKEAAQKSEDHVVPGMEMQPHEHYDYLVVMCRTTHEWNVLCTRLKLQPSTRRHRIGVGRGVPASDLLKLLGEK